MPTQTIEPVTLRERIRTIDFIRGFALLGILLISFTVDDSDISPYVGWTDFGDQLVYWSVKLLMDDRFQSIYCFLFGLGFTIQMQRAAARNVSYGFIHVRRMIALYLIGVAFFILTGGAYVVLCYYAMVGILLLLFRKVPSKLLPILSLFFFLLPVTRNTIAGYSAEIKTKELSKVRVNVDTAILDKYVGVYELSILPEIKLIYIRKGDTLIGEGPTNQFKLITMNDSTFLREDAYQFITFLKDSNGKINQHTIRSPIDNPGDVARFVRIDTDIQEALNKQLQRRNTAAQPKEKPGYGQFVIDNANFYWKFRLTGQSWRYFVNQFLWRGGYNGYKTGFILVLFLLGMYVGRRKVFEDISANMQFFKKLWIWGLVVGGTCVVISFGFEIWNYVKKVDWNSYSLLTGAIMGKLWDMGIMIMALSYVSGLTILLQKTTWKNRLSFLETVGRLGLTNYLLQLIAYLLIIEKVKGFLSLSGKIGCLYRLLIALGVYVLLYLFSRWWLRHFRMGPFEWLWRSLTYLKFQPMRLNTNHQTNNT